MLGLEAVAYSIARGMCRAYLDILSEPTKVIAEKRNAADELLRDRVADAVNAKLRAAADHHDRPDYSPQAYDAAEAACSDEETRRLARASDDHG